MELGMLVPLVEPCHGVQEVQVEPLLHVQLLLLQQVHLAKCRTAVAGCHHRHAHQARVDAQCQEYRVGRQFQLFLASLHTVAGGLLDIHHLYVVVLLAVRSVPHKLPHGLARVVTVLQEVLNVGIQLVDKLLLCILVALDAHISEHHVQVVKADVYNAAPRGVVLPLLVLVVENGRCKVERLTAEYRPPCRLWVI